MTTIDRRAFLGSAAVLGAMAALRPRTAAAAGGMRKAVYISMLPKELPYPQRFQLAKDVGFEGIEIGTVTDPAVAAEIEEALIEPIEEAMRGLPGLVEMRSESNRGQGGVGLTFEVGTDMTRVMLDVVSRLNTLPPLPPDADEPQVFGGDNWHVEETYGAMTLARRILGEVLEEKVRGGYFTEADATRLASKILSDNASILFRLPHPR